MTSCVVVSQFDLDVCVVMVIIIIIDSSAAVLYTDASLTYKPDINSRTGAFLAGKVRKEGW